MSKIHKTPGLILPWGVRQSNGNKNIAVMEKKHQYMWQWVGERMKEILPGWAYRKAVQGPRWMRFIGRLYGIKIYSSDLTPKTYDTEFVFILKRGAKVLEQRFVWE